MKALLLLSLFFCSNLIASEAPQPVAQAQALRTPEEILEVDCWEDCEDCSNRLCIGSALLTTNIMAAITGGFLGHHMGNIKTSKTEYQSPYSPQVQTALARSILSKFDNGSAMYTYDHVKIPTIASSEACAEGAMLAGVAFAQAAVISSHGTWALVNCMLHNRNAGRKILRARMYAEHHDNLRAELAEIRAENTRLAGRIEELKSETKKTQ